MIVHTCCGCCSLRTGTIIIGILETIVAVNGIISNSIILEKIHSDDDNDDSKKILMILIIISIGSCCISLLLSGLLLFGAFKQSRYFLLPWLVMNGIGLVLVTFGLTVAIILTFTVLYILAVIICVLAWYPWICVLSYFKELSLQANALPLNLVVYHDVQQAPGGVTYVTQQPPTCTDYQKGQQAV